MILDSVGHLVMKGSLERIHLRYATNLDPGFKSYGNDKDTKCLTWNVGNWWESNLEVWMNSLILFGAEPINCLTLFVIELAGFVKTWKVVRDPLVSENGTKCNHGLPKQQVPKSAYKNKTISTPVSNVFSDLEEDIGKADSPKRHVAFSLETKLRYFDRDDMEFDDLGKVGEEMERGNASSENG
nr:hypothetical protein [Tanacetum cinerariifolium]